MSRRKSKALWLVLVILGAGILVASLVDRAWSFAASGAALAACGVSMLIDGMARFTKPLFVCMLGLSLIGSMGHGVPHHRIVGWALIAISPLLVLLDYLCRKRGTPLFTDGTNN